MAGPHQVALTQLASIYLVPPERLAADSLQPLCRFLLEEVSHSSATSIRYPRLAGLLESVRIAVPGADGEFLGEELLNRLLRLESPDDLLECFMNLKELMATGSASEDADNPSCVEPRSALGIFIRRSIAEVLVLPFEGMCRLWEEVADYAQEAQQAEPSTGIHEPGGCLSSFYRIEHILDRKITSAGRVPGRERPSSLEEDMAQLTALSGTLPKVHLVRHHLSLQQRDASAAEAHLHRYFDYSSGRQRASLAATGANKPSLGGAAPGRDLGPDHLGDPSAPYDSIPGIGRFQSALLSLGASHTALRNTADAYAALEETVRIAQQASDSTVLVHALAALCRLGMASTPQRSWLTTAPGRRGAGTGSNALPGEPAAYTHRRVLLHLLQRCLTRSRELKLPHLVAFARLAIAQVRLHQGAGAPRLAPRRRQAPEAGSFAILDVRAALQEVENLCHLSTMAVAVPSVSSTAKESPATQQPPGLRSMTDIFTSTSGVFSGPAGAEQSSIAVQQLAGQGHLLSAAAWDLHGCSELCALHGLLHIASFSGTASSDDTATAILGLSQVAASLRGADVANAVLERGESMLPEGSHNTLAMARLCLQAKAAAAGADLRGVSDAAGKMSAMAPPGSGPKSQLWLQAELGKIESQRIVGNHVRVLQSSRKLFNECLAAGEQVACVRLLGLMGRTHLESGSCTNALPYLLACASHCDSLGMEMEGASASVSLAEAWCAMGPCHAARALELLRATLPIAISRGSGELRARSQLAMARAMLLVADRIDLATNPGVALKLLSASAGTYSKMGSWSRAAEAHYLGALVADSVGLRDRRDSEARSWQECLDRAASSSP